MYNLFRLDSKPMLFCQKLFQLMVLNLLTLLFSIPVITAGAAFSAMHTMCLKLARKEDITLLRDYVKAFRGGFMGTTAVWLGTAAVGTVLIWDLYLIRGGLFEFNAAGVVVLCLFGLLFALWSQWFFLLRSRYENGLGATMANAMRLTFRSPKAGFGVLALGAVPVLVLLWASWSVILVLFFGFSLAGLGQARLYGPVFRQLEQTAGQTDGNLPC